MKKAVLSRFLTVVIGILMFFNVYGQREGMALVKGGVYTPFYGEDSTRVKVKGFYLDVYPVTNADYIQFLKDNPKWRKSNIIALYANDGYLSHFKNDLELKEGEFINGPVRNVTWFTAKKYCEYQGKRLPTMDEWEFAAMADEKSPDARETDKYNKFILSWYEKSKTYNNNVGSTYKNYWGVYDMHGLVWEWVLDFNTVLLSGEGRNDLSGSNSRFCGGAVLGATDLINYAAFMRFAFRGSLKANYSIRNLGFRCAQSIK